MQAVYRFAGCVDLGGSAATPQSMRASRGSAGTPAHSMGRTDAAGRTQARTRRDEEHA